MRKNNFDYGFLKRILKYGTILRSKAWIIAICLILSSIFGFFQPLIIRNITDNGLIKKNPNVIIGFVLLLLALVLSNQMLEILQTKLFARIHKEFKLKLWKEAFHKILHLKMEYYYDKNNTEILNRIQTDVEQVSSILDRFMAINIGFLFRVISGIAGLLFISWKLTMIVLVMVPVKYLTVQKIADQKKRNMDELIESACDFSAWMGDNIDGIEEIKLWNLYPLRNTVFEKKLKQILDKEQSSTMLDAFNMFCEIMLGWSVTGILYILGGIFAVNGTLTIGGVFSFITYSNYVTGPISSIINIKYFLSRIAPSAQRLFRFFDLPEELDQGKVNEEAWKENLEIRFRNVSFAYQERSEILKDISFCASKGEKIAIIGSNGSGKTTLVNLLLRFIHPKDGTIELCNENINQISLNQYRSLISVVSQDPFLFHDTIHNNINLDHNRSDKLQHRAYFQSGARDFINRLPEKENSMTGRNGAKLSGGERQKLAVARAMVKNTPIVILDEATSGYDVASDLYLHDILLNELKEKTVIMITHRYENLVGMDRIYRLSEGKLVLMDQ